MFRHHLYGLRRSIHSVWHIDKGEAFNRLSYLNVVKAGLNLFPDVADARSDTAVFIRQLSILVFAVLRVAALIPMQLYREVALALRGGVIQVFNQVGKEQPDEILQSFIK